MRCITVILSSVTSVCLAFVLKIIIDAATSRNISLIYKAAILSVLYLIISFGIDLLNVLIRTKYLKNTMGKLKDDLFNSIMRKDIKSFNDENSAKYISFFNNDIRMLEDDYFSSIFSLLSYLTAFIISVYSLISISIWITISIFIMGLITFIIPNILSKKLVKNKELYSKSLENFTTKTTDMLKGFEIIKNFNLYSKMNNIFHFYNINVEKQKQVYTLWEGLLIELSNILGFSMFFITLILGGFLVVKGEITLGSMMAATQLMNNVVGPLSQSASIINRIKSIKKISEKFESLLEINDDNNVIQETSYFSDSIKFKEVSFSYIENKSVLNNINLEFKKDKKYAVVGTSGCGKSTILKLILKYYNNFTGDIYIDGSPLNNISENYIYNNMSIIQQNVFIFDGTIKDNVALYQDYTDQEIMNVLRNVGLSELIESLPNGIYEHVGEGGNKLSGGEKQRIAIARALLKSSPIIMLDESTSALDNETSYSIERAILSIKDITLIVIT